MAFLPRHKNNFILKREERDRFVAYAVFLQRYATMQTYGLHLFMLINIIMPWPVLWQSL